MTIAFIKRTFYLFYYFKQIDKPIFQKFLQFTKDTKGYSTSFIWYDILKCVYKYNIGIIDYFIFRFFDKSPKERKEWCGTGFMYEYQLKMNPKDTRHLLADKIEFYKAYSQFVVHANCTLDDLRQNNSKSQLVLNNTKGKIVVKDSLGQCGWNLEVIQVCDYERDSLIQYMSKKGFNLAEEFIEQHNELSKLSPSGLNTIRIITQLNIRDEVEILGARLRISVNSSVDNLASGNIAAPINHDTGKVYGVGIYSDITKDDVKVHPVTGVTIPGFHIPFWEQALDMVKKAAILHPENKSIGWDVAITEAGPELIEGNHNWCKTLWQLPVKQGLKPMIQKYMP